MIRGKFSTVCASKSSRSFGRNGIALKIPRKTVNELVLTALEY
jgi:hypothetical protein